MTNSSTDIFSAENLKKLSFEEHEALFEQIRQKADASPEKSADLLPQFYQLLNGSGSSTDMLHSVSETFISLTRNFSSAQISEVILRLEQIQNGLLISRYADTICGRNPNMVQPVFDYFITQLKQTSSEDRNRLIPLMSNITTVLYHASDADAPKMFACLSNMPLQIQKMFSAQYGKLYENKPVLRPIIWEKIEHTTADTPIELYQFYQNLRKITVADATKAESCLHLISKNIQNPANDEQNLLHAYYALGAIRSVYPQTQKVDSVFLRGMQHPANTIASKKAAYRCMGKTEELRSRATIGQRIDKSPEYHYGFRSVEAIDPDEPAILFLGGNGMNSDQRANGTLKHIDALLLQNQMDKNCIGKYASIYDFGPDCDQDVAFNDVPGRNLLLKKHFRPVKIKGTPNADTINPRYIEDIFNKAFSARICDKNGCRLSLKDACTKMRKLTVAAHCHGAYTFLKLEEMIQDKMRKLGYSDAERQQIQRELLCVAYAPHAPLGVSKSTMISFASAKDWEHNHSNNFEHEVRRMSKKGEFKLSYFPAEKGELMIAPSMGEHIDDHDFLGYNPQWKELSPEGKVLLGFAGNAMINGIKSSISGTALPSVRDLLCGRNKRAEEIFNAISHTGAQIWQMIQQNTVERLKHRHAEKTTHNK